MPATTFIHLRVTADEHEKLKKRAGGEDIAAFLRKLLGLPPRKAGRPPKRPPAR